MKKFRSILAVLLAAAMIICFSGCAAKEIVENLGGNVEDDNAKAVGEWTCSVDVTELMEKELEGALAQLSSVGGELKLPDTKINVYVVFDFAEDKSFVFYVDEDATIESVKGYVEDVMESMVEWMYGVFADQGIDRETADAAFTTTYGMGISDYLKSLMEQEMDAETMAEAFSQIENVEGFYKFEDGKLYIAETEEGLAECEEYLGYTIEGDVLTINEGNAGDAFGAFEEMGMELPLVFERN